MVLKLLIYRGLVVLLFFIPSQYNIAYQSKHNMRYNQEKLFQTTMLKSASCYYKLHPPYVYIVRRNWFKNKRFD
jgi:hypothetical protein